MTVLANKRKSSQGVLRYNSVLKSFTLKRHLPADCLPDFDENFQPIFFPYISEKCVLTPVLRALR